MGEAAQMLSSRGSASAAGFSAGSTDDVQQGWSQLPVIMTGTNMQEGNPADLLSATGAGHQ